MRTIGQRERFGSHLGLERIELLCEALGNPQDRLKFIHVAGTNGKGSVSAFLSEVLALNGYRVGLFTSPHLENYQERFQINGSSIAADLLETVATEVERACALVEKAQPELGPITEFEMATAVAFLYFHQAKVDVVVLETGLGGRLDATNVVSPLLTVITTIGHDHTDRLGTSLQEIAWEKGGIIKKNVPVVSGVAPNSAQAVLIEISAEQNAPWHSTFQHAWEALDWNLSGGLLSFAPWGEIKIGLLGEHQLQNAATALLALHTLKGLGWQIKDTAVKRGMAEARWPGRLELVSQKPLILLDGGHNQEGIAALGRSLRRFRTELGVQHFTFVVGMLSNKDPILLDPLFPLAERFVFTAAESGRFAPLEPEILAEYARSKGVKATAYGKVADALADAVKTDPVCICGSLYLVGTVKRFFHS